MNIERNILLKNLTTFKIGGLANYFCKIKSLEELKQAVNFAKQNELPIKEEKIKEKHKKEDKSDTHKFKKFEFDVVVQQKLES